jgi:hypothetical protein
MDHPDQSTGDATTAPDKTTGGVSRLAGLTFGTDEDSFHSQDYEQPTRAAPSKITDRKKKSTRNTNTTTANPSDKNRTELDFSNQTDDTDGMMNELGGYINQKHPRKSLALNDSAAFIISPPSSPEASRLERGPSSSHPKRLSPGLRTLNSADPIRGGGNHLTLREQEKVSHLFPKKKKIRSVDVTDPSEKIDRQNIGDR